MDSIETQRSKSEVTEKEIYDDLIEWIKKYSEEHKLYLEAPDKNEAAQKLLKFRLEKEPNYIYLLPKNVMRELNIKIDENPKITLRIESLRKMINGTISIAFQKEIQADYTKIKDREKALNLFKSTSGVWQIETVFQRYWKKAGVEYPEIPLFKQPLRISIENGVIGFARNWQVERWSAIYGEDLRQNIQVIDQWKFGCRAILTAKDHPIVEKIMNRVVEAVINDKRLRIPSLQKDITDKILNEYKTYHTLDEKKKNIQGMNKGEREIHERSELILAKLKHNEVELKDMANMMRERSKEMREKLDGVPGLSQKKTGIQNNKNREKENINENEKKVSKKVLKEKEIRFKDDVVYINGRKFGSFKEFQRAVENGHIEIDWNMKIKDIEKNSYLREYRKDINNDELQAKADLYMVKKDISFCKQDESTGEDFNKEMDFGDDFKEEVDYEQGYSIIR